MDLTRTSTTSAAPSFYTGDPAFHAFPHARYASKFYRVISKESGLTNRDTALWNYCYLPHNPLPYDDEEDEDGNAIPQSQSSSSSSNEKRDTKTNGNGITVIIQNPEYKANEPPCWRQRSVAGICNRENVTGMGWEEMRDCLCEGYPFWESVGGCNACFEMHGGTEGYHYFPSSYISAVSKTYCGTKPQTTGFYDFVAEWAETAAEARVPSTTAVDLLGTQTAASLYYTETAGSGKGKGKESGGEMRFGKRKRGLVVGVVVLLLAVSCV